MEPISPSSWHEFTPEDREAQLCDLELLCDRLADLLAEHGDTYDADLIRACADGARELQATGYSQSELNELAGGFPSGPDWLNPKALDYDAPRKPWQDDVARLHALAAGTASDLRAVARQYRE